MKLLQPSHKTCSTTSILKKTKALTLNLLKIKSQLIKLIEASSWDNRLKSKYLEYLSREEIEDIVVSCNYHKGISITINNGNAYPIAIWFEAIWSLFTGLKSIYKKNLKEIITFLNETNSNIVVFMGQDTEFYYALAVSAILLGIGVNNIIYKMSIQRFIKLSGKKFSSSRGHTIFLEELTKKYHIDVVRLYSTAVISPYFANNSDFSIEELDNLNLKVNNFIDKLLNFKVEFVEELYIDELTQLQDQLKHINFLYQILIICKYLK
ncbi:MAG: tRNA synthetase class family protein [Burkholderiales bacterium]|nr:tRNA synthetase class family protein [Burkholderiales bacterium]